MEGNLTSCCDQVRQALARPESYAHQPSEVDVRETHISWVFLAGEFAYKLKKPLVLDFLDYGTPERRRQMCEDEVRLNRRLAPDVYLGVRGVALASGGAELTASEDPRSVDYVVEMRRYDERQTLASRLGRGGLTHEQVDAVADVLARFHRDALPAPHVQAPVLAAERRFEENIQGLLARLVQRPEIGRVQSLERFAHAFVTRHAETFKSRAAAGWVRDGHGDLRAEHVLVDGGVRIVDCVEFDPALRHLDVADDLAFLVLDLVMRGGEDLGRQLLRAYRESGGDPGSDQLISFYAAYRALVRAKVELVRASQLARSSAAFSRRSATARELIAVAEAFAWRARLPLIIIVCGLPASGKSHLARALAVRTHLPHLSSDVTRKQMAGITSTHRAPESHYSADWNARTYAALARRVTQALETTGGAIVDATFRHRADRQAFGSALESDVPRLYVECRAPH
ncbi:MAG: AAA family ATPase, partial [Solirubrobacterales bacterium]|nr:AAA family ATPase [Solirubrobacterales bacterium]